jgi:hypothetical protein
VEFAARLEQAIASKSIKHSPSVLANIFNAEFDGSETELTASQQQLVRKYIKLSSSQQKLVSDLVDEISG